MGSSKRSLKRSRSSRRTASIYGRISAGGFASTGKIVFDALRYQSSGSRTDNRTSASGFAAASSGQNDAPGQSTSAEYPASIRDQSAGRPSMASIQRGI